MNVLFFASTRECTMHTAAPPDCLRTHSIQSQSSPSRCLLGNIQNTRTTRSAWACSCPSTPRCVASGTTPSPRSKQKSALSRTYGAYLSRLPRASDTPTALIHTTHIIAEGATTFRSGTQLDIEHSMQDIAARSVYNNLQKHETKQSERTHNKMGWSLDALGSVAFQQREGAERVGLNARHRSRPEGATASSRDVDTLVVMQNARSR